jgi:hypothetical protein
MSITLQLILIFIVAYFANMFAISTWEEYKRRQYERDTNKFVSELISELQNAINSSEKSLVSKDKETDDDNIK